MAKTVAIHDLPTIVPTEELSLNPELAFSDVASEEFQSNWADTVTVYQPIPINGS